MKKTSKKTSVGRLTLHEIDWEDEVQDLRSAAKDLQKQARALPSTQVKNLNQVAGNLEKVALKIERVEKSFRKWCWALWAPIKPSTKTK